MFDNIGEKIKMLAKVVCWIGIVASIIIGVVAAIGAGDIGIVICLLIVILGGLLSWVGSFVLYGFGELVQNSAIIAVNSKILEKSKPVKEVKKVNAAPKDIKQNIIDEEDDANVFLKQLLEGENISQSYYDDKLDELNFIKFEYSEGYISENEYFEKRKAFIDKLKKRG
jgi:hypothetical protein